MGTSVARVLDAAMKSPFRPIAFYLPQFHPIPENDEWWGRGFTEWTNTAKAKPLFPGHQQPNVPGELGFYDLRLPETRHAQAELARAHGVEGFCYYEYWFAGRRVLQRPFAEVLESGQPEFPFCICWANESWTGIWHGTPNRILVEQTYPGETDHRAHFEHWLAAFRDERYIRVERKPLLMIYRPEKLPDARKTTDLWRDLAHRAGLPGLYLVGVGHNPRWDSIADGFDAIVAPNLPDRQHPWVSWLHPLKRLARINKIRRGWPAIHNYADIYSSLLGEERPGVVCHPCVIPNWDNTPRSGRNGLVLHGSTPELFRAHLKQVLAHVKDRPPATNLVFIKSWNEWAEGNYLEPDLRFGRRYLEVLREELARTTPAALPIPDATIAHS
jgi:lipopolysaccharide biosynthesis protein